MSKTQRNEAGFSLVEVLVVIVLVAAISLVGWYVWKSQNKPQQAATASGTITKPSPNTQPDLQYVAPEGYRTFTDTDLGFRFAYPSVFGSFSQKEMYGTQYRQSDASTAYGPGISGSFVLYAYGSASQSINSRKYGPQISLQNGKWIVTKASDSDISDNVVGQEYRDADGKILVSQTNGSLEIYTIVSGDEGGEIDSLAFVANDKLYLLSLPQFDTGTYNGGTENDKATFNQLLSNVRDSIHAVQ